MNCQFIFIHKLYDNNSLKNGFQDSFVQGNVVHM